MKFTAPTLQTLLVHVLAGQAAADYQYSFGYLHSDKSIGKSPWTTCLHHAMLRDGSTAKEVHIADWGFF
jgi:hypothetical protein